MSTSNSRQRVFTALTLFSVLTSIILTLLPLLPDAAIPLLTVRTSLEPLYGIPAAITRPMTEVIRLGPPAHKPEEVRRAKEGNPQAGTFTYASKVIAAGFGSDIVASESGNEKRKRNVADGPTDIKSGIALLPEHMLDAAGHVRSEEYESLRNAGLSDAEAYAQSKDASMWLNGHRIDSRIIKVGALNVCLKFKYAKEVCRTVREFKEDRQDGLTNLATFPIDTPAPILLVISLAGQISLLLTIICGMIPWTKSISHIKYRLQSSISRYGSRARQGANTDSVCELIEHRPFCRINNKQDGRVRFMAYDYAFVALWLGSFAFGVAGADILLAQAIEAKKKVIAMGDDAVLGAGIYLLAVLSFVLLLPLGFFLLPFALQYRASHSEPAGESGNFSSRFLSFGRRRGTATSTTRLKPKDDDDESVKSFTCTPYVLPYSKDAQAILRPDEVDLSEKRETKMVKADDGEWEMIIPAPKAAHFA